MTISAEKVPVQDLDAVTIRFAGDAGDGMQLVGSQFTSASARAGNDISTLPDYPAEIRAPAGSLAGVSGFQIHFSKNNIHTPGDVLNTLVAMNPAALRTNLGDLESGGILLVNSDAFTESDLHQAGYDSNPLDDGSLKAYRVIKAPIQQLNRSAVASMKLTPREADRCKNFFALGLVFWLYDRPLEPTLRWIQAKFAKNQAVLEANALSLKAGHHFGETTQLTPAQFRVAKAPIKPGKYRKITGTEALTLGLVSASQQAKRPLVFASYTTTPASDLLHQMCELDRFGVRAVQAEDEAAAIGMAIGAAFGGALGVTATSSPGMCLKAEAIGLAVMAELPVVIINVQRGGPATGLPTKPEQADLLQALFGSNGEAPVVVLAASSPADCFQVAFEACRIAVRFMTPVIVLSDVYLAHGAEPWLIPAVADLGKIDIPVSLSNEPFQPYRRDERLVRPWALPGTPGQEHRIGGLEKQDPTGEVDYEPANHDKMTRIRTQKVANVAHEIPPLEVVGPSEGDLLVVGWGSTHGAILSAVERAQRQGRSVACAHFRHLNPMPTNTGEVLSRFKRILVPEMNLGQLRMLLRAQFLVDAVGLNKVEGRPFHIREIEEKIAEMLGG